MLVTEIMSSEIVWCDIEASLQTAVEQMLIDGVGSIIVTREGDPFGIVTETDVLHAGAVTEQPFSEIPVEKVASHPLITASTGESVRTAIERMQSERIKKLPVVEEFDIVGIVTQSDITDHYQTFVREAHRLEQQPETTWDEFEKEE